MDDKQKKQAEQNKDALAMLLIKSRRDADHEEMMRRIKERQRKDK